MLPTRDKVVIGGCLLAIFVSAIVLGIADDPSAALIVPFSVIIFVSVTILCIGGLDAWKPGIFDSCADPNDLERRDANAMREARITNMPV